MSRSRDGNRRVWSAIKVGLVLVVILLQAAPAAMPGLDALRLESAGASPVLAAAGAMLEVARVALLAVIATGVVRGAAKSPSNQWIAEEMLDT